jgi:arylsulfatase A-like enzyme
MFGLYNGTVRIPLIIRLPGGRRSGEVDDRKGQLVDLFPTILGVAGVNSASFGHRGVDLLAEENGPNRESIFSEYYHPDWVFRQFTAEELERQADKVEPFRRRLRAIQRYGFRLIWSSNGRHELYDVRSDPRETRNLLEPENRTAPGEEFFHMLLRELEAYAPGSDSETDFASERDSVRSPADVDDATLKALRAVGYVR